MQLLDGIPKHYPPHVYNLKIYVWKPIIIEESLEEWKSILWLDAGCDIRAPITPIIDIIEKEGIFLVQGQDLDMTQWIHNKTLEFMNKSKIIILASIHSLEEFKDIY